MSKEAIVEKILSDAGTRAESFVSEQKDKADDILAEAAEQCKSYIYTFQAETDRMVSDIESRAKTVAELDARKLMLAKKTELLDRVFDRATEKLVGLDRETARRLLLGMLGAAEDGDVITLGARQQGCLDKDDIERFAAERGISLTLSKTPGNFDGMVLSGKGVDKNLTYGVEISLLRESIETEIAKEIFG